MGLFDKKFCDICGEKISFLGNHKLEDGNMCSACNKKMSPFFNGRRKTTVEEMKQHLTEREQNRAKLASFVVGSVFGDSQKIYLDAAGQNFLVTYASAGNFEKDNPDIIPITAITSCNTDVKEIREEEYTKDANGNRVSFNPPRYRYFYDFKIDLMLNWRWFNEISVKLNSSKVEGLHSANYHNYEVIADQARRALLGQAGGVTSFDNGRPDLSPSGIRQDVLATAAAVFTAAGAGVSNVANAAANTATAAAGTVASTINWTCPSCGVSNDSAFCKNCGQAKPVAQNDWVCPSCGVNNDGAFCKNCGQPKPAAQEGWTCPSCGVNNDGAFCKNCGQPKPGKVKFCGNCGWKADADNAPNFCPQCGTKL